MAQKLRFERNFCVCRLRLIFPARLQASIVSTAKLNFCVRNGNRWTLCVKITDSRTCWARFISAISRGTCQRRPIFPARLQASIVGTAKLNFCVRNGNRWTLCAKDTDYLVHLRGLRTQPQAAKEFFEFFHRSSRSSKMRSIIPRPMGRRFMDGAPPGTRTPDPLIKSQLLYQLS